MVQANVDNPKVDINLSGGNSTTVPSGESWKITFLMADNNSYIEINGKAPFADQVQRDILLHGGDQIGHGGSSGYLYIRGWVISQ